VQQQWQQWQRQQQQHDINSGTAAACAPVLCVVGSTSQEKQTRYCTAKKDFQLAYNCSAAQIVKSLQLCLAPVLLYGAGREMDERWLEGLGRSSFSTCLLMKALVVVGARI
jgi:hypothetical protein